MTASDKPCHMLAAVVLAFITSNANGHPLEDAAERATALCSKFEDVESLDYCGTEMLGTSPERREARAAVRRLFDARAKFMRQCEWTQPFGTCLFQAEWYMGSGVSRLNAPVQYTDATPSSLPRSDKRR